MRDGSHAHKVLPVVNPHAPLLMPSAGTLRAVRRLLNHHPRSLYASGPCSIPHVPTAPLHATGFGGLELTFLGSSSQGGARRYPSCLAMRLRALVGSEVWLFDAGEGAVAQLQRSSMKVGTVKNIFITHLHGDHLYGLPSVVLSVLRSRMTEGSAGVTGGGGCARNEAVQPLDVYGPQGLRSFLRMSLGVTGFYLPGRDVLRIHELVWPTRFGPKGKRFRSRIACAYCKTAVKKLQYEGEGRDIEAVVEEGKAARFTYRLIGDGDEDEKRIGREEMSEKGVACVVAAPVLHTVPTFAYAVRENVVARRFDKSKLLELEIPTTGKVRELFSKWMNGDAVVWEGKKIEAEEVMQDGRSARKVCVVGDTYDAEGAEHIAKDADVLVHEATNAAAQTTLARMRGHSSTLGATSFAKKVNAKRLVLNHTSVGYSERKLRSMEIEARGMFGGNRTFVARDLSVFTVPTKEEDNDEFTFRRFIGFGSSMEFRGAHEKNNPFSREVVVEDGDGWEVERNADDEEELEGVVLESVDGDRSKDGREEDDFQMHRVHVSQRFF